MVEYIARPVAFGTKYPRQSSTNFTGSTLEYFVSFVLNNYIGWKRSPDEYKAVIICAIPKVNSSGIYMFKVNNKNTRTRCEICSKLTVKTPERGSGVFIVNFGHISHLVLAFLLLNLNMRTVRRTVFKPNNVDEITK